MTGALDGINVVDFGQYIAGPLAAVMLADQGAEVIHVDPPGGSRWKHPSDAFFNRGKQRITLDLKSSQDLEAAQRLIESADVVIENFRPGVMDRLGLGSAAMLSRNARLIYCSLPGFGHDDPRAGMQAWEGILHAATDNSTPRAGEEPEAWDWSRPFFSAVPLASNFAGFLGATGIVLGLIARHRTGRGQFVEVPLFDAMFTLIGHSGAYAENRGLHPPSPIHLRGSGAFRCKDGKYVQFDTSSARHLTWFARAAGITSWGPDLLDIDHLKDAATNQRLHARLRALFLTRTAEEWEEIGNSCGAAIGWCRTTSEWIANRHAQDTGAVVQLDDPELGLTWMPGVPVQLSDTPAAPRGPRHRADQDRQTVLTRRNARVAPSDEGREPGIQHPLEGIKVLDLCVALAGPTCGRLLHEFGAEVIKVSQPQNGVSGYLNRGKRSILLNLSSLDGQRVFWKLAEGADVLVENLSPSTSDRLGIGYEEVRARHPEMIYASLSCYGHFGPWTERRGWERQGQAVTGVMERTGEIPAVLGPYNLADIGTGVMGSFATVLAIFHRFRTGRGQRVFASLAQTCTYHQAPYMLEFAGHKANEPRGYYALGTGALNRYYQARDGWFFLALPETEAHRLQQVVGLEYVETSSPDLAASLEASFLALPRSTWIERLHAADVAAQAVTPVADLMRSDVARNRGLIVKQVVNGVGETTAPGISIKMSATPLRVGAPPRPPGSDAESILNEVGMASDLTELELRWAIQASHLPAPW
jgi:crotonobetainyl-CoA:carnitine CoA-transferase CaiB-like acyl-CoA transferase